MTTNDTRTARERAEELLPTAEDIQEQFISGAMLTGFAYSRAEALRDWEAWREREQAARDAEPTTVTAEEHQEAASQLAYQDGYQWSSRDPGEQAYYLRVTKRVLAAINIRIEGDEA